jgi:hypothetical protein
MLVLRLRIKLRPKQLRRLIDTFRLTYGMSTTNTNREFGQDIRNQVTETAHCDGHCPAIFVREGAERTYDQVGIVPEVMKRRVIALRGYDSRGFIVEADIAEGEGIERLIGQIFENSAVRYIHAHNAKRGCFSGLIERA